MPSLLVIVVHVAVFPHFFPLFPRRVIFAMTWYKNQRMFLLVHAHAHGRAHVHVTTSHFSAMRHDTTFYHSYHKTVYP